MLQQGGRNNILSTLDQSNSKMSNVSNVVNTSKINPL